MRKLLLAASLLLLSVTGFGQTLLKYVLTDEWKNNNWAAKQRLTTNYDANNYVVNELYEQWDTTTGTWANYYQYNYTNNSSGVRQQYIYQMWDKPSGTWTTSGRGTTYYTATGKYQGSIFEGWVNNGWVNSQKFWNTLDANEHVTKQLSQYWDNTNNVWYDVDQTTYINSANGDPLQATIENWIPNASVWSNFWKYNYSYNGSNKMATIRLTIWTNNAWVNSDSMTFAYNTANAALQSWGYTWIDASNSWRDATKLDYTYNANNTLHQYTIQRFNPLVSSTWYNDNRFTYIYTFPTAVVQAPKPVVRIYPDPATDKINIALPSNVIASITVTNMEGALVKSQTLPGNAATVDVQNLPAGTYLLHIMQGSEMTVKPFVKQ